jgi:hypothetical protein
VNLSHLAARSPLNSATELDDITDKFVAMIADSSGVETPWCVWQADVAQARSSTGLSALVMPCRHGGASRRIFFSTHASFFHPCCMTARRTFFFNRTHSGHHGAALEEGGAGVSGSA